MKRGNCYVASEAIYHLTGGRNGPWRPEYTKVGARAHWYLRHRLGHVLDVTAEQFRSVPDYEAGRGCGFLTIEPSKRARALMEILLWQ